MAIEKELLDQLLAGRDPNEVFAKDGCLIPGFDGAQLSHESKEALWARFFMGSPRRQRRSSIDTA